MDNLGNVELLSVQRTGSVLAEWQEAQSTWQGGHAARGPIKALPVSDRCVSDETPHTGARHGNQHSTTLKHPDSSQVHILMKATRDPLYHPIIQFKIEIS